MEAHMLQPKSIAGARTALGAQEPVNWIEANGARLAVMRRGTGFPILCLSAIAHGARDFENLPAQVGDGFEIIALDWPGHGLSPSEDTKPSAAHYAALTLAAMDALGLSRAILLGNSIGGAAALQVATTAPERVAGLVLCNTGGLVKITPFARFVILRMAAFFGAGENGKRWFAGAYRFYYRRFVLPRADAAHRDRIIAAGPEMAATLRAAWESFAAPEADARHLPAKVQCPVFIAWAKSDRIIQWSRSRAAVRRFRDKRIQFFRGGHAAFLEDGARFAKALRAFAARCVKV
jgi:4,5:9,10-diseco-3-hydroxy-5,9,17-trioxoandrosta-1(10),2-diene-4-oate hydrolase